MDSMLKKLDICPVQPDKKIWFGGMPQSRTSPVWIRGMGWRERMPGASTVRPRGTGDFFLALFYDGIRLADAGGLRSFSEPVVILWEPRKPHHYGSPGKPYLHSWIHFSGTRARGLVRRCGLPVNRAHPIREALPFERMLTSLHEEITVWSSPDPAILQGLLETGLRCIHRALGTGRKPEAPDGIKQAKNLIEAEPEKPWSVADLAGRAGYSRQHFNELFRHHFGCPPMACLARVRMELAAHLLHESGLRIGDVAAAVGFDDPYHFSRAFRKFHGLSPRDWRRELLQ